MLSDIHRMLLLTGKLRTINPASADHPLFHLDGKKDHTRQHKADQQLLSVKQCGLEDRVEESNVNTHGCATSDVTLSLPTL